MESEKELRCATMEIYLPTTGAHRLVFLNPILCARQRHRIAAFRAALPLLLVPSAVMGEPWRITNFVMMGISTAGMGAARLATSSHHLLAWGRGLQIAICAETANEKCSNLATTETRFLATDARRAARLNQAMPALFTPPV